MDVDRDSGTSGKDVDSTRAQSTERRIRIHRRLGLPESYDDALVTAFPDTAKRAAHVIESDLPWEPWFPRNGQSSFYWDHYAEVLRKKGFGDEAIADLDSATSTIVGRLADPSRAEPYQSKGLVVGYVQSGKTANFAGSIAKAIDAGYKLIIVLTGTIEFCGSKHRRDSTRSSSVRRTFSAVPDETSMTSKSSFENWTLSEETSPREPESLGKDREPQEGRRLCRTGR